MAKTTSAGLRKPKRSLRTILIAWFIVFSVIPLFLLTGYSLVTYERAIDNELVQLLRSSVREFSSAANEYEKVLVTRRAKYRNDPSLIYYLSTNSISQVKPVLAAAIRNSFSTRLSLFDRDGKVVVSLTQDQQGQPVEDKAFVATGATLSPSYLAELKNKISYGVVAPGAKSSVDFVMMTRLDSRNGRVAGYIEDVIKIGKQSMEAMKKRLALEIMIFDSKGSVLAASNEDLLLYPKDLFAKTVVGDKESFFPLQIRQDSYLFSSAPIPWADSGLIVGLGASKERSKAVLKNVTSAFFSVVAGMLFVLALTGYIIARILLRPLNSLVEAIQSMDQSQVPVEIPVTTETEVGALTEAFNEMSQRVTQARSELEGKIEELKKAYQELKETQARLVHSAKMASLGQLVAGVAHELNNPIGFIYSNIDHLRDYSEKLMRLIETAEKNPKKLEKLKTEFDYEYIVADLPRLIKSCEDGARRIRDIVLGLRNFSRLEEAKLKEIDLEESIENTLKLLAGELKARIKVHVDFESMPKVLCYASQLNQVFMNVLANAAQAIDGPGEIWIKGSVDKTPVAESARGRVLITVRDSGKGMEPEILEKIFDPFFTTKGQGQGTGLGLSISYGIVKKHGGDLLVKSIRNKGTEFTIVLPVDGPPDYKEKV